MARRKKPPTLAEFGLPPELLARVQDLREGFLGAPENRVVAHALEFYLTKGIDTEPEVKRRCDEAREKRQRPKT
jgi:hypothetical protein